MIDLVLSRLAPHICSGCSDYGSILCECCKENIINEDFGRCLWCLKPATHDHQCATCRKRFHISGAWAVGERTEMLKRLIDDYKFESRREAAGVLAELLDSVIPTLPDDAVMTWVPTVRAHVRTRGFDHAACMATQLGRRRHVPTQKLLVRHQSVTQHELGRRGRLEAAQSAFGLADLGVKGKSVVLIDDVLTTGATLQACALLLRDAGAEVYVVVVARQPLDE